MPYQEVQEPLSGPQAFEGTSDAAILSQSAILLLLGAQLRGDYDALNGRASATGLQPFMEAVPHEDLDRFPVPRLQTAGERVDFERVRFLLATRYGSRITPESFPSVRESLDPFPLDQGVDLARRLYDTPDLLIAAQLLELYLYHPNALLRVAAAASYFDLSAEPSRVVQVLADGTSDTEDWLFAKFEASV